MNIVSLKSPETSENYLMNTNRNFLDEKKKKNSIHILNCYLLNYINTKSCL